VSQVLRFPGGNEHPSHVADSSARSAPDAAARLASSLSALEREIADLWRDSIGARDAAWSQRLAELSHTLRRAALMLEGESLIGESVSGPAIPAGRDRRHDGSDASGPETSTPGVRKIWVSAKSVGG
jgi:hypothetical protein